MTKIFSIEPDDGAADIRQWPTWTNQPLKPNPDDPYWDRALPCGLRPDSGSDADGVGSGFPIDMPLPVIRFEKPLDGLPFGDFYLFSRDTWLLSDRAKEVFESIDADAFEFAQTSAFLHDSSIAPKYWLADVVRVVDAVDERHSDVLVEEEVSRRTGKRVRRVHHGFRGEDHFYSAPLKGVHIFRALYSPRLTMCDERAAQAIAAAHLRGIGLLLRGSTDD